MFGFNKSIIGKFIADWSAGNMTPDVTSYEMSFDVSVTPRLKRRYNIYLILIRC